MIQETDQAILDLVWRGSQVTGRVLKSMIQQYVAQHPKSGIKHGEQNLADLNLQGKKLEEVVIVDEGILDVKRRLKAYAVDFSIMRDPDTQENHVFFKAQDYERVKSGLTQVAEDLMNRTKDKEHNEDRPQEPMKERIEKAATEADRRHTEHTQDHSLGHEQHRDHSAR